MEGDSPRTAAADEYEAKHMATAGEVVHRDKRVSRLMAVLLAVPALLTVVVAVLALMSPTEASAGVGLLGVGLFFALSALLFSSLRTSVSTREVHIQYGIWGPRIPLDALESCQVVDYNPMVYGGWGIKLGVDGVWAFSMPGAKRALRLEWTTPKGKTKKAVVTADDPDRVLAAIERARTEATKPRVRVSPAAVVDAELAELEEQELGSEARRDVERER